MSDERSDEQDPPTARLNLGDVAAWLQRSGQQESADNADPAPEEAPAAPESGPPADAAAPEAPTGPSADSGAPAETDQHDGPRAASEQPVAPLADHIDAEAGADLGAQDSPSLARDVGDFEAAPPMGDDAHHDTDPARPPPDDDTVAAGDDAPSPAGYGEAAGLGPGVLAGSDERSTVEAKAPLFDAEPEGGDHGPPGPAVGEAGPSSHDPESASADAPAAQDISLAEEAPTEGDPDGSDNTAARYPPAPAVPAAVGLPESEPDIAGDNGLVERAGGGERTDDLGSASLFELDLTKLAERARASAVREAVPAAPHPLDPGPAPDPPPITARDLPDPFPPPAPDPESAPAPSPFPAPDPVTDPSAAEDEPGQPVAPEPAVLVWGDPTQAFDLSRDEEDDETDSTEAETVAGHPQGKPYPPPAAARARRAKRPRYPRGQLREPIGILRRIRAMLGIVVVTVLLGVAAGTAVGAFIFFLAFAVRNAITAQ